MANKTIPQVTHYKTRLASLSWRTRTDRAADRRRSARARGRGTQPPAHPRGGAPAVRARTACTPSASSRSRARPASGARPCSAASRTAPRSCRRCSTSTSGRSRTRSFAGLRRSGPGAPPRDRLMAFVGALFDLRVEHGELLLITERARVLLVRQRGARQAGAGEQESADEGERAHQRTVTGVPTGMIRARRRMSALRMRMHPCDTRPGSRSGRSVPWIPMKPPAGQSVKTGDRASVPKATGPYCGLAKRSSRLRTMNRPCGVGQRGLADADRDAQQRAPPRSSVRRNLRRSTIRRSRSSW